MAEILFRAPTCEEACEVLRSVAPACREQGAPIRQRVVWLDTFDWRLAGRDRVLTWREEGGAKRLFFDTLDGETLRSLELDRPPAWPAQIPASPLRDDLERWLEPRRLLVLAQGRRRGRLWEWRDSRGKTIASLSAETLRVRSEGSSRFAASLDLVRVVPVKGYEREARPLARKIEKAGFERVSGPGLELVMDAVGREPLDYTSRFEVELRPEERTDVAMVSLYRHLLEKIEANQRGAVEDLDPEFLHDLRVSVRRTRSLLGQIGGVFPQRSVESFQKGFRWVQGFTGPVRDLHVWLLDLPDLGERLASEDRAGLAALEQHLVLRLEGEHRKLGRTLQGRRYAELLRRWRAFLDQPHPEPGSRAARSRKNATRPVVRVASKRIWRVYRRMLDEGGAISDESPAQALHALRIRAKKLRYLLEAFRSVFPATLEDEVKALKRLQDHLGDFNDCAVQRRALRSYRQRIEQERELEAGAARTFEALEADIDARAENLRRRFAGEFERFAAPARHDAFRRLLEKKAKKSKKSKKAEKAEKR